MVYSSRRPRLSWAGFALVLGLHVILWLAFKLADRIKITDGQNVLTRLMLLPQPPTARPSAMPPIAPGQFALPPRPELAIPTPPLPGTLQPALPILPQRGLNLTIEPSLRPTIEQAFPSPEQRRQQFFRDQIREDERLNRSLKNGDHACDSVGMPTDRLPTPSNTGIAKNFVPGFVMAFPTGAKSDQDDKARFKPCN
jgi:hypothetical protein